MLAPHLAHGSFVIVLGGGHETSFGHFQGYASRDARVGILNWDAHPDVRELQDGLGHAGLGVPAGDPRSLRAPAASSSRRGCCRTWWRASHLEFLAAHGARFVWRRDLSPARIDEIYGSLEGPSFVSFDIDAVDQAEAPGASSPSVGGIPVDLWLHAAYRAGRTRAVRSCDVVEMNPVYDRDNAAARLAAATVWHVLKGLVERELQVSRAPATAGRRSGTRRGPRRGPAVDARPRGGWGRAPAAWPAAISSRSGS